MPSSSPSRFAVFSDVHGNLPALHAFFEDVESRGFDRLYCCGDLVGYGAHPGECCDLVQMCNIPVVLGNHDQVSAGDGSLDHFNEVAADAILWTRRALAPAHVSYLQSLPYTLVEGDFTFVHASPREPEKWNYVLTRGEAVENFARFDTWICFIGHSHQPFVVEQRQGDITCPEPGVTELHRDRRYLVNVGSVGQPRDRNPQLCYVTVDLEENRPARREESVRRGEQPCGILRFHRVPYPVFEAQRAILDAGLPVELADRLSLGW
jgi:diadenosine tetraphosphatase ApaH/serine/threonine PP2A family protein phosphatase